MPRPARSRSRADRSLRDKASASLDNALRAPRLRGPIDLLSCSGAMIHVVDGSEARSSGPCPDRYKDDSTSRLQRSGSTRFGTRHSRSPYAVSTSRTTVALGTGLDDAVKSRFAPLLRIAECEIADSEATLDRASSTRNESTVASEAHRLCHTTRLSELVQKRPHPLRAALNISRSRVENHFAKGILRSIGVRTHSVVPCTVAWMSEVETGFLRCK